MSGAELVKASKKVVSQVVKLPKATMPASKSKRTLLGSNSAAVKTTLPKVARSSVNKLKIQPPITLTPEMTAVIGSFCGKSKTPSELFQEIQNKYSLDKTQTAQVFLQLKKIVTIMEERSGQSSVTKDIVQHIYFQVVNGDLSHFQSRKIPKYIRTDQFVAVNDEQGVKEIINRLMVKRESVSDQELAKVHLRVKDVKSEFGSRLQILQEGKKYRFLPIQKVMGELEEATNQIATLLPFKFEVSEESLPVLHPGQPSTSTRYYPSRPPKRYSGVESGRYSSAD